MNLQLPPGQAVGVAAALFAVLVWAAWIPVTRLGVITALSPWDLAVLRFGVAGLVLLPILVRRWREVPWRRSLVVLAMAGGAGIPYLVAFGYGLRIANSGQGAVLGPGANGALVALLALAFLGERPSPRRLLGLAITLAGVGVVIANDLALGAVRLDGFALILFASLCWASYTVASRVLLLDPVLSTAVVCVANAIVLVPGYFALGGGAALAAAPASSLWLQVLYQGVLTAVVALIAYAFAVQRLGPTTAATFTPLAPVMATVFGWLMLGDRVDAATATGLAMVVVGVIVASRAPALPLVAAARQAP